ncbi:MAG: VIT1/CCC1 transporter family protein [Candidatus Margulisbacteria bacterium]|jgi:VIT1/CCC1 family predicted Fe2+/Mn2+ transporter|nr:VIT1/CCC1 transporter family protein [Candidatus Margulisiibacteriota bacterium]
MNNQTLKTHIENEHNISPFSTYLKEFVYGGNDGIVTTFAVVAGFSGANIGEHSLNFSIVTVLLFGLANLFADGAAMGLGNYLSIRSEKKLFRNYYEKELHETQTAFDYEIEETELLFQNQGFNKEDSKKLTQIVSKNSDFWVKFMVQHECDMNNPEGDSPLYCGLATFSSFVFFGFIPLIPYFLTTDPSTTFVYSSLFTVGALALLGSFRAFATKDSYIISIIETLVIGGTAAILAYIVGLLFKV